LDAQKGNAYWSSTGVEPQISFTKDTAYYELHGQCMYWYPTKANGNEIVLFWAYNEDCVFDAGLKKTYDLKNIPTVGKPFSSYKLINDSTIRVKYFYPQWVKRYNQRLVSFGNNDSVFPTVLKRYPHW